MTGRWLGFIVWLLCGLAFTGMGIYTYFSKKEKPFGFWANASVAPISDVKRYNRALGKLWVVFGIIFILLGLPLICGQNSAGIAVTILGASMEVIVASGVYTIKIEGKYRRKE
ncbi:MAG: hypothetical protein J6K58_13895 [Lachnospiraceae bacterium]|nr:hypothetical protein [Lachnospiraceae bacterium]